MIYDSRLVILGELYYFFSAPHYHVVEFLLSYLFGYFYVRDFIKRLDHIRFEYV